MTNNNNQGQRIPGISCPQCGNFIPTSVTELLSASYLQCPHCQLQLNIDRKRSIHALQALEKVEEARRDVEQKSKFYR